MKKGANGRKPKKSVVIFKFYNEELGCRCLYGRCPNYNSEICGKGGIAVYRQYGHAISKKAVKELVKERKSMRDQNYGNNIYRH